MHRHVDAIQMGTHNICLYKEVDRKYTGCNLKTMELLDYVLRGVCAILRLTIGIYKVHHNETRFKNSLLLHRMTQMYFCFYCSFALTIIIHTHSDHDAL